ncbi:CDP-alcohol phosphatidyltransferase family protein [Clostridium sp. LY3-2]|uniref:CDP-alcohol phosphatidyltransferase family protein n=1 Tax=Clostridium TaxID=1485 RepID=UPI0018842271|nr:CDP-alcohol phosphatidyltransferase family protein [Clostridium sp. LY3-2]MCR6515727.1 CDP-alcohol phosphatidyltransferase family protein [Clostridium sp. LY3-2]
MLDTYGRKYVNPLINLGAKVFLKLRFTPNLVTVIALITGILAAFFNFYGNIIIALLLLWISGYLDSVDGAMARKLGLTTPFGTLLDITFDRLVELSIIISIALKYENTRIYLLFLLCSILISMTIFLTVGALSKNNGVKSFRYQAGVAERTEGFIMFSLIMCLEGNYKIITINIFTIIILITIFQRIIEAKKLLK